MPWWLLGWRVQGLGFASPVAKIVGGLLAAAGTLILIDSFARFAIKGLGTPAPIFPTKHLVVGGLYRYVRNPMYVGVLSAIFGQALIFASLDLVLYGLIVWLAFHLFVTLYEEPTLRGTFGDEYEEFCKHVPRWIPRITPWRGAPASPE
ncbi:MAG: isoprenylcysteine carboxyl methyltransferase [Alphaproteobacteria bacterium]|nr:isoprenylcysteine carboxyl methyltransferase [Alphaproteobacteria bacterium]